ncbi:hypothetical protein LOK74_05135 [Brevibacillus humidisoli]|uniref:hypothetical protein n=1 Tax=Brevibacillus humidisoli TaxID=2895522 RepID=UPI001E31BFE9|nr:hypothetical protein [Brevibacillus humidisoli]UFJ41890.1 hypothetical protein LOK74_05135 [Brevibacillus humidisoli]
MLKRMYGVEVDVSGGKLPGFYAQIVHKIGDSVQVFDRDQQLFIVQSEEERQKLFNILQDRQMAGELFDLWLLPDSEAEIDDYGFVSLSGRAYLYDTLVAFFRFLPQVGTAEDRWAALQQMEEHLITPVKAESGEVVYIVDRAQTDLIEGIARAFQVKLEWLTDFPSLHSEP